MPPAVATRILGETTDAKEAWAAVLEGNLLVLHVEKELASEWHPFPREYAAGNLTYLADLRGQRVVACYWTGRPGALPENIDDGEP